MPITKSPISFRIFLLVGIYFLFLGKSGLAQKFTFLNVPKEVFTQKGFGEKDSADVVILFDSASVRFSSIGENFTIITTRYQRMKILTQDGVDNGTVVIKRFSNADFLKKQPIFHAEGATFNLSKDQSVRMTKLDSTEIFKNELTLKLAFSNVKPGSVIDYSYSIEEPVHINLCDWEFQHDYPVAHSAFSIIIPEFFNISTTALGKNKAKPYKNEDIEYRNPKTGTSHFFKFLGAPPKILAKHLEYYIDSLPALIDDKYIINRDDYRHSLYFILQDFQYGSFYQNLKTTWDELATKFLKDDKFIVSLSRAERIRKYQMFPIPDGLSRHDKLNFIVRYVKDNFQWDGKYSPIPNQDFSEILKQKKGNSAELNLVLHVYLKVAGFDSYPVIISPRGTGKLKTGILDLMQLELMVIGITDEDDNWVFRDASNKYLNDDLLPLIAYNGQSFIPQEEGQSIFVDLNADILPMSEKYHHDFELSDKEVSIHSTYQPTLFTSARIRRLLKEKSTIDDLKKSIFIQSLQSPDSIVIENENDIQEVLKIHIYKKIALDKNQKADTLKVFYWGNYPFTPFKAETRDIPIEFDYKLNQLVTTKIKYSGDMSKVILPSKSTLSYGEQSILYHYEAGIFENNINIMSRLRVNKTFYTSDEYPEISQLFKQIVLKQNEKVILVH